MEQQVRRTIRRRLSRRRSWHEWHGRASSGFTPARIEEIRIQLLDPFDPAEIKWRVTGDVEPARQKWPGETGPVGGVRTTSVPTRTG